MQGAEEERTHGPYNLDVRAEEGVADLIGNVTEVLPLLLVVERAAVERDLAISLFGGVSILYTNISRSASSTPRQNRYE